MVASLEAAGGRVRLDVTGIGPGAQTVTVNRVSLRPHATGTAAVPWQTSDVRGWSATAFTGSATTIFDYEYDPGDGGQWWYTTYRLTTSLGVDLSVTIRPQQTEWWIKSVQNPSRNLAARSPKSPDIAAVPARASTHLTMSELGTTKRSSRVGTFPIVGSPLPVIVTDVHTSAELSAVVLADDVAITARLETLVCGGDVLLLQAPAGIGAPGPLWAVAGDWQVEQVGVAGEALCSFPLTQVAPPPPLVIGAAWTYALVHNAYGSYAQLKASWPDYATFVAGPAPGGVSA
jgi:hypothetical protein